MAITIQAQLSKKIPIPNAEYSSQQASITISAEVTSPEHVTAEAQRLYELAELAVDTQLGLPVGGSVPAPGPQLRSFASPSTNPRSGGPLPSDPIVRSRPPASRPFTTNQQRGPAPATESQISYLNRLITQQGQDLGELLDRHRITDLRQLSCKAAAGLIDAFKSSGVRS